MCDADHNGNPDQARSVVVVMAGCSAVAVRGRPVLATPGGFGLGGGNGYSMIEDPWPAFLCALFCAWPAFWFFFDDPNPKVPFLAALIAGVSGSWVMLNVWRVIVRVVLREDAGPSVPPQVHDLAEARYLPKAQG